MASPGGKILRSECDRDATHANFRSYAEHDLGLPPITERNASRYPAPLLKSFQSAASRAPHDAPGCPGVAGWGSKVPTAPGEARYLLTLFAKRKRAQQRALASFPLDEYEACCTCGTPRRVTNRSLCDTPLRRNLRATHLENGLELCEQTSQKHSSVCEECFCEVWPHSSKSRSRDKSAAVKNAVNNPVTPRRATSHPNYIHPL